MFVLVFFHWGLSFWIEFSANCGWLDEPSAGALAARWISRYRATGDIMLSRNLELFSRNGDTTTTPDKDKLPERPGTITAVFNSKTLVMIDFRSRFHSS